MYLYFLCIFIYYLKYCHERVQKIQHEEWCKEKNTHEVKSSAVFISKNVPTAVFFVYMSTGSALSGILYYLV